MKRKLRLFSLLLTLATIVLCMPIPTAIASHTSTERVPIESAFTDAAFLKAVREIVGKTSGEPVYQSDVEDITKLELINLHLANLDGIEYFTGLKELYCYDNDILTLDLSQNPNLEVLDCAYNTYLVSIDISNCPELRLLDCNYTALERLDVSRNTKLTRLVCYDTYLESLDISNNPLLELLDVWGGRLVTLDVSNNPNLKYLDCTWNNISSVENVLGLEYCTALEDGAFLFEPQNERIDSAFTDAVFLKAVRETVGKTNSEPIYQSDVESITVLNVSDLDIETLDGIEYFKGLKELYCYANDLITIDVSHNPNLKVFDCSFNPYLVSINVSNCSELTLLDCNNTELERLDLSQNAKLTQLLSCETNLEALDISHNPLLEILDVWGGRLKNLNVSNNRKLKYLACSWNDISSVDSVEGLENCTALSDGAFLFEPQSMEGHDWNWDIDTITIEPTCTQKGKTAYICSECQLTKFGDTPPLGHSWNAWTITTEPSLTATGTAQRVCNRDSSHAESVSLPVLTDTMVWTKGNAVGGKQEYTSTYGTVAVALPSPPPIDPGTPGIPDEPETPDQPDTPKMVFIDVKESDWFYGGVKYVYEHGLMVGTEKDRFSPGQNASRAMIAAILWRLAGSPAPTKEYAYTDCKPAAYYAKAVSWATEQGILMGYGEGLFGPNAPITREQLAAALYRYAGKPEAKGSLDRFTDGNNVSGYALDALCWAVEIGIVSGKGEGVLDPTSKATRAEVAAMIHRFMTAMKA